MTQSSNAQFKAAVVGGTGYGGAELIRLLMGHPSVNLTRVSSIDSVGKPLEAVHLSMTDTGISFEEIPLAEAAKGVDVVFLGLPHKVSSTLAPEIEPLEAKVIDLSGDFRLRSVEDYKTYYGEDHPHPEQLDGRWQFGLPELFGEEIAKSSRVSSPGCFATTIMLALVPLARAGCSRARCRSSPRPGRRGAVRTRSPARTTRSARTTSRATST